VKNYTPGPTALHPAAAAVLASGEWPHHRDRAFTRLLLRTRRLLREWSGLPDEPTILSCAASGAMEAALRCAAPPGGRVLCGVAGRFGERFAQVARALGLEVERWEAPWGEPLDPDRLRGLLEQRGPFHCLTLQSLETSTGVEHPLREITTVLEERGGPRLVLDAVGTLGVKDLPALPPGTLVVGGSAKACLAPPGLAFLWGVDGARGGSWLLDASAEEEAQREGRVRCTPNTPALAALAASLEGMRGDGFHRWRKDIAKRCSLFRKAVAEGPLAVRGTPETLTLTPLRVPREADGLRAALHREGYAVGRGQGPWAADHIRVGNMAPYPPEESLELARLLLRLCGDRG